MLIISVWYIWRPCSTLSGFLRVRNSTHMYKVGNGIAFHATQLPFFEQEIMSNLVPSNNPSILCLSSFLPVVAGLYQNSPAPRILHTSLVGITSQCEYTLGCICAFNVLFSHTIQKTDQNKRTLFECLKKREFLKHAGTHYKSRFLLQIGYLQHWD